jgi:hypothetical protein
MSFKPLAFSQNVHVHSQKWQISQLEPLKKSWFVILKYPNQGKNLCSLNLKSHNPKDSIGKKYNNWKQRFMFSPPLQKTLNVLCINLVPLEHFQFPIHQFLGWLIGPNYYFKNVKTRILICHNFRFYHKVWYMVAFQ